MTETTDARKGRREFLRTVMRGLALGGLGLLAWIALRRRAANGRRETCIGDGVCRGCPGLEDCGLPQALSLKRSEKNRR